MPGERAALIWGVVATILVVVSTIGVFLVAPEDADQGVMGFVALAWLAKRCKRFPDGTLATLALELIGTIIFLAYPSTSAI